MNPREILEYYQGRTDTVVNLVREFIEIESPSHYSTGSRQAAAWVEKEARATGADISVERISVDDGDHILIRAFPNNGRPTMLLGHTDTVHPLGASKKNPTRIEGDRFYGCGIFDMKSNVVLMLETLRFFAATDTRSPGPVTILLSCDEEIGSSTGRALVEREAAHSKRCLVLEPSSEGKVKTGRKGTGIFTLRANGIPAHAGLEPEKGANAVAEIGRQIEQVHAIADVGLGTSVNVCTIRGGTATNVIPEHAECDIDVRFSSLAEARRTLAALRGLKPFDDRVSLELLGGINRPPLERTEAVVEFYNEARREAAEFGYDLSETQVGGASDGNFVAGMGVPVLDGLGISGAGAHTLNEFILVSDIARRATLVTLLLSSDDSSTRRKQAIEINQTEAQLVR